MSSNAYSVSYRGINTATATDQKGEIVVNISNVHDVTIILATAIEFALLQSSLNSCHQACKVAVITSVRQLNDCFIAGIAWQDGHLIITRSSGWMWLKDSKRVTIRKGTVGPDVMNGIVVSGMVKCAGYDIKILHDTTVNASDTQNQSQVRHTTTSAVILQNENLEPSSASFSHQRTHSTESSNRNMTVSYENKNKNKNKPLNSGQNLSKSKTAPQRAHSNQYDSVPSQQKLNQNPSEAKPSNLKTTIRARPSMGLDSSVTARREKQAGIDSEICVTAKLETQENVDDFRKAMNDRKDKMIALKKSKVQEERQVMSEQRKIIQSTHALCPLVQSEMNRHKMKQNSDSTSSSSSSSSSNDRNSNSNSNNSRNSSSSRDNNYSISNRSNNSNMIDQSIAPTHSKCNGQVHLQQREGSIDDGKKGRTFNKYMMNNTVAGVEYGNHKVGKHSSSKIGSGSGSSSNNSNDSNYNSYISSSSSSSSSCSSNHSDNNSHNTTTNTSSSCTEYPILDPQVLQVMRPHQLQAAVFLLNVLMGRTENSGDVTDLSRECADKVRTHLISTFYEGDMQVNKYEQERTSVDKNDDKYKYGSKDGDRDKHGNEDGGAVIQAMKGNRYDQSNSIKYPINRHTQEASIPLTGAILADDMGTGKVRMALFLLSPLSLSRSLACLCASPP